jgi:nucleoside-diphosphate-sugar epimerase
MGSEVVVEVKVLVTGAAGFLASSLVDRLVECGEEIRVLCK